MIGPQAAEDDSRPGHRPAAHRRAGRRRRGARGRRGDRAAPTATGRGFRDRLAGGRRAGAGCGPTRCAGCTCRSGPRLESADDPGPAPVTSVPDPDRRPALRARPRRARGRRHGPAQAFPRRGRPPSPTAAAVPARRPARRARPRGRRHRPRHGPHAALVAGGRRCSSGCSRSPRVAGLLLAGRRIRRPRPRPAPAGLPDGRRRAAAHVAAARRPRRSGSWWRCWSSRSSAGRPGGPGGGPRAGCGTAVTEVGREQVVAPVRDVLKAYAEARDALAAAAR